MNYNESWLEKEFRLTYESFKKGDANICNLIGYDDRFYLEQEYPVLVKNKIFFVDFYEPSVKLAVELDGFNYHHTPKQIAKDIKRDRLMTSLDFTIMRIPGAKIRRNVSQEFVNVYHKYCQLTLIEEVGNGS